MYELVILTLLTRWPMHGYLIASIINDMIGPFAKISNGRLYPLLAKLQEDGLIATEEGGGSQRGDRRQRRFTITDAGRKRSHQLMMDTTSNPGDYQRIFWLKMPFINLLQPSERLYLLDHYLNYCQTHIFHLAHQMDELIQEVARDRFMTPEELEATLYVMRHYTEQWQRDAEHVREWRAREVAHAEGLPDAPTAQPDAEGTVARARRQSVSASTD